MILIIYLPLRVFYSGPFESLLFIGEAAKVDGLAVAPSIYIGDAAFDPVGLIF